MIATSFEEILKLIELEDDDKISSNSSLTEAILETKESLAAAEQRESEYMGVRSEMNGPVITPNTFDNTLKEYAINDQGNLSQVNLNNNESIENLDI